MELRSLACALPSNAPAFDDIANTGRVLQERCGNRQDEDVASDLSTRRKYIPSSPVENLYRNSVSTYVSSHGGLPSNPERKSEEQVNRETAEVWRALQRCHAYCKYRDKQAKDDGKVNIWPEHMEYAFFKGLVKYEPMGRRKLMLEGKKSRGRNELVAASIEKDTGISRRRKQVSSHIQVLKGKLKGEPQILKYMSKEDLSCRPHRHAPGDGGLRSRHSTQPSKHRQQSTQYSSPQHFQNRYFSPLDFEMYVRDTHEDPPKHIYTYTQSPKNGPSRLDDVYIRDARQWRHAFPSLSAVSLDRFTDCELVVCDASIAVMTDPLPKDVELATQFWLKGEAFYANFSSFSVRNSFIDANPAAHPPSVSKIRTNEPDSDFSSHNALSRHYLVPFCSKFWARRMQHLSTFLRHARSHPDVEERAKREAYVRSSLEGLTATQEIFGVPKGGSKPVRIAAIFWRFSQTVGREEGRTVWRSVVYSPQRQSPSQPQPAVAVHEIYPVTQQPLTAYPALSFDLPPTHQHTVYDPIAIHDPEHPGPFGLDTLSTMAPEGAFAPPTTALPLSIPTSNSEHIYHHIPHSDAHFHCLPSLFHSYDSNIDFPHSRPNSHLQPHTQHHDANQYTPLSSATTQHHDQSQYTPLNNGNGVMGGLAVGMSSNELDFTGGSINICLEPAIGMGSYPDIGTYNHTPLSLSHEFPIHAHGGQVQDHNAGVSSGMESANLFSVEGASARPWNSSQELMEQLEGCEAGVGTGLGVSMGGPVESAYAGTGHEGGEGGMWRLQSPFEGVEGRDVKEEERGQVAGGY